MGNVSYRLRLTGRFTQLHPVFHVSQLAPYQGVGDSSLPPPVLVGTESHYEVERIVGHRATHGGTKFIVRWLGYGPEEDSLMSEAALAHAPDVLHAYKAQHGL